MGWGDGVSSAPIIVSCPLCQWAHGTSNKNAGTYTFSDESISLDNGRCRFNERFNVFVLGQLAKADLGFMSLLNENLKAAMCHARLIALKRIFYQTL